MILAVLAPAADNIVTFFNFLKQNGNIGRIVLEITVKGDNNFTDRMIKTSHHGVGLAVIST